MLQVQMNVHKENGNITQIKLSYQSLDMSVQLKVCLATSKSSKTVTPSAHDN